MNFSQRNGKTPIRTILQKDQIDYVLKKKLWNEFYNAFYLLLKDEYYSFLDQCFYDLWTEFYINKANEIPETEKVFRYIEHWFFEKAEWFRIYDFIENISLYQKIENEENPDGSIIYVIDKFNNRLNEELSAYRIVNWQVTLISDEIEIQSIEEAINDTDKFSGVSEHLNSALKFLSDRENPDYRNSIKESISAVESICRIITGESTLGKALKKLESSGIEIHQQLKNAFEKLYLFTNDKKTGIRHALIEEGYSPTFDEAKFMIVSCSAFINYLKSKSV